MIHIKTDSVDIKLNSTVIGGLERDKARLFLEKRIRNVLITEQLIKQIFENEKG